jgi:hypothetical protein
MFWFAKPNNPVFVHSATVYSVEPNLVKLDVSISEIGGSGIPRISDEASKTMMADPND